MKITKKIAVLAAVPALALGLSLAACSGGGGNSSGNPDATDTSAYSSGYAFGTAAGTNGSPESNVVSADGNPSPCTNLDVDGIPVSYGVPSGELPPGGTSPAAYQWVNGCYAGLNNATGTDYPIPVPTGTNI
jgi:hypothetical protein